MPVTNYITVNGQIQGEMRTGEAYRAYALDRMGNVSAQYTNNSSIPTIPMSGQHSLPYGKKVALGGQPVANQRFMWLGGHGYRQTSATPDVYVRARHYATREAAWTSVDPLWPSEAAYGYVGGRPVQDSDPGGAAASIGDFIPNLGLPIWPGQLRPKVPGFVQKWLGGPRFGRIAKRVPVARECHCHFAAVRSMDKTSKLGRHTGHDVMNAIGHCATSCYIKRDQPECEGYWRLREAGARFGDDASIQDEWNNEVGFYLADVAGDCIDLCIRGHLALSWYEPDRHNWPPPGYAPTRRPPPGSKRPPFGWPNEPWVPGYAPPMG